ncbi:MAG: PD-(D/E)XK motif protein [Chloroflexi bacterium]|nr:PD-(D/E)XK motif protein [Chloroflexota bacterium]
MRVADLFQQVKHSSSGHTFTAAHVPKHQEAYIASDTSGRPILFVRAEEWMPGSPLRTAHVSLRPSQTYRLTLADGSQTAALFHALCCETAERSDVDTFLVLVEAFLARYEGQAITGESLVSFFRSVVRLFAVGHARDIEAERLGLWGELFVMSRVRGLQFWAPFWHSETTRRFDFSAARRRVEVKTTIGAQRIHHFSHRQIYAESGEEIVIASLLVREDDAGLSLRELVLQCRQALLGTPHIIKLERAVRSAGMEDPSETGPAFDPTEAERELAWFRSTEAPHFRMPEPPGVSETRYKVDLSTAPQLVPDEVEEWLDSWVTERPQLAVSRQEW